MTWDVLIIGGGPAGLSAAINVRARGRSVLVVSNPQSENPLWQAERVDNYPGMPGVSGAQMLETMQEQARQTGVSFMEGRALTAMRMGDLWYISVGSDMETARAVVLAAGVVALIPLQPVLQAPALQPAFDNVVPALFGAMAYKYYRGNLKIAALPLLAMILLFVFVPSLSGATSFMVLPSGAIAIGVAFLLYKKGRAK